MAPTNTAYSNSIGFNMLGINSSGAAVGLGTLKNNISYGGRSPPT
ncbi:hypothetical protein [Actinoplanes campanulatus]|nr:hypothetical protein [Actinoplanes campanulatus]